MTRIPSLGPRGEGWVVLQILAIGLVVVSPRFDQTVPSDEPLSSLLRTAGLAIILASGVLLLWGYIELRRSRSFSILPRPIAGGELVDTGPYRLIRNPIYSALVLGGLGIAAARSSVLTVVATIVLFVVLDLKRRREEVWLASRYPGYAAYRDRTKAFIPFVY